MIYRQPKKRGNLTTGEELKQQIALYESADHTVHLDVKVDEDTVWLNRQQLALLFGRDIKTIGKHVGNALREELNGFSVVTEFATTASDGKTYQVEHYNLEYDPVGRIPRQIQGRHLISGDGPTQF